jgi:hypothetical protein
MSLEARGILFVSPGMEVTALLHFIKGCHLVLLDLTNFSFFLLFQRHMKAWLLASTHVTVILRCDDCILIMGYRFSSVTKQCSFCYMKTMFLWQVNPVRTKELTNIRAPGKDENVRLTPPRLVWFSFCLHYLKNWCFLLFMVSLANASSHWNNS